MGNVGYFISLFRYPRALNSAISLMALYLHFGKFRNVVLARLDADIFRLKAELAASRQALNVGGPIPLAGPGP